MQCGANSRMMKTKHTGAFDDGRLLLYPDDDEKLERCSDGRFEAAVSRGVACRLEQWPSHLLFVFLTACFVISGIALVVVTLAFYLPLAIDDSGAFGFESSTLPNVYFVKHGNRTWTTQDYCYIESAAREHLELDVYLVNIVESKQFDEYTPHFLLRLLGGENSAERDEARLEYDSREKRRAQSELRLKRSLTLANANVRQVDVTIEALFNGSNLSNVAGNLAGETLEMAAKAYLLWNSPGIALDPSAYCVLKDVRELFCEGTVKCEPDKLATVHLENNLQATEVPCQAFLGFLMRDLSSLGERIAPEDRYTLKAALDKFCSAGDCPEVRVLDPKPRCSMNELNCPTVYPPEIHASILDNEYAVLT